MTRRAAANKRYIASERAINLLKVHPKFPDAQVQIYDQTKALIAQLVDGEPLLATDARMDFVIQILDIRSRAYLALITDLGSQEAYMTMVGEFARNSWEQYLGFPFEAILPDLQPAAAQAVWGVIQARSSYWIFEGYRVVHPSRTRHNEDSLITPDSPSDKMTKILNSEAIVVFASYSHADERLHDELAKHLRPLEREGIIRRWHDRQIIPGSEFGTTIDNVLNEASIILLLVSPDFVASEYCWSKEMKRAMERHGAEEARVIPIILRPVDWQYLPFGQLLALPKDGKPVVLWSDHDDAYLDVARGIRAAAADISKKVQNVTPLTLDVRSAAYTIQFRGAIVEVDIGNQSVSDHQIIQCSLELSAHGMTLEHTPGPPSLAGGAPWLPRVPLLIHSRKLTRCSLFFSTAGSSFKDGLPHEPLVAKLRIRFYLGPTIERELEIYTFDTLRKMEAFSDERSNETGVEPESPAQKLKLAVARRQQKIEEKQLAQGRIREFMQAALSSGPKEFQRLEELLQKSGVSLNEERLPDVPVLEYQSTNHRLDAGTTYSIELSPYAQMHSYTVTIRIGLHPNAAQCHDELPNVSTTTWNFQAQVNETGFSWIDPQQKAWSSEQIIHNALHQLIELLSAELDDGSDMD